MSGGLLTWSYPGNPVPKELKNFGGIYRLTFENKKFYIGQSINLFNRISEHIYKLKSNIHCNKKLQNTFNKYHGKKVLVFSLFVVLALGLVAGDRNKFPGRRQGGGSKGALPSQITSPEVCVTTGCEPIRL